jgi:glycosyltransferase involved in cell wall biosynthesis
MENYKLQITNLMNRIWFVSELYYPEETSTGYYITRIAEGLAKEFEVHVLCGQPTYSARGTRALSKEVHNGVSIKRCVGTTLDKNVLPFKFINILTLTLSTLFSAIFRFKKGDTVMVVTTPPSLPFIVAFACWLRRARHILLIHDNYPEIAIASKLVKPRSFVARVMQWLNGFLYRSAWRFVVVGRDMKILLEKKVGGSDERIYTIPNWAELETVHPLPREENALLNELGLKEKFVLLYAGNMGYPNDIESIIESARLLREQKDIHFVFLGSGVKRRWLKEKVKEKSLENVTLLSPRPRSEQTVFLNACDVGLVSLVKGMCGVSMPSRTYNLLAAGKPMIALTDAGSELALVLEEDSVGWSVPPGEPERLAEIIMEAYAKRNDFNGMVRRARKTALEKYSLEKALSEYRKVFVE